MGGYIEALVVPYPLLRPSGACSSSPVASMHGNPTFRPFLLQMLEQLGVTADNYELEWCGDGSRLDVPRAVTWPLFVKESGPTPGAGKPFGYLR